MNPNFYTTVTLSDFKNVAYINQLKELNIGMELALLTDLSDIEHYKNDLEILKKEITDFKSCFDTFKIPIDGIRIHQPGGYSYSWYSNNKVSGYDLLKDFFSYCSEIGFRNYVIHAPYGDSSVDQDTELNDYKEKLSSLVCEGTVEVEEITVSNNGSKEAHDMRFYSGALFEKLMEGQLATILLDTYECGGVNETIERMKGLKLKGFEVKSIHLHKDKHKFLTGDEVGLLLKSGFDGNLVNEGFIKKESSFDEFVTTRSIDCTASHDQRIEILKRYRDIGISK